MRSLLLILDGMGLSPDTKGNAVTAATMPVLFGLMERHGWAILEASGRAVGLEDGQAGNSEVGHLTIGAGQRIPSRLEQIAAAFRTGEWQSHSLWPRVVAQGRLHVLGLLSDAGIHGHLDNLWRGARLAVTRGATEVHVHVILDGVDSQAGSWRGLLERLESQIRDEPRIRLASIMGRRWAMDRSGRWDLTRVFCDHLRGRQPRVRFRPDLLVAHAESSGSEWDFPGCYFEGGPAIGPNDVVLLTNHRADRTVQLAMLLKEETQLFAVGPMDQAVAAENVFFPERPLASGLIRELRERAIQVRRVAEKCKFPHVTLFVNGFHESLGETAVSVPSIAEEEIESHPEMSIDGVFREVLNGLSDDGERAMIANVANLDQVGHRGRLELAQTAAGIVDTYLGRILEACRGYGWNLLITSDHGNAEKMLDNEGKGLGSHSVNPVPMLLLPGPGRRFGLVGREGSLANVAASFMTSLGVSAPSWMAQSLIAGEGCPGDSTGLASPAAS